MGVVIVTVAQSLKIDHKSTNSEDSHGNAFAHPVTHRAAHPTHVTFLSILFPRRVPSHLPIPAQPDALPRGSPFPRTTNPADTAPAAVRNGRLPATDTNSHYYCKADNPLHLYWRRCPTS